MHFRGIYAIGLMLFLATTTCMAQISPKKFLAWRDIKPWTKLAQGKHTLFYGSGDGSVANILSLYGLKIQGVDLDEHVVKNAKDNYPNLSFTSVEDDYLPFVDNYFDIVISNFVLSKQATLAKMVEYISEGARVLNDQGIIIASILSPKYFQAKHKWGEFIGDNKRNYIAGEPVLIKGKSDGKIDKFFYWELADYKQALAKAGLEVCATHAPLGNIREQYNWQAELNASPIMNLLIAKDCKNIINNAYTIVGNNYQIVNH